MIWRFKFAELGFTLRVIFHSWIRRSGSEAGFEAAWHGRDEEALVFDEDVYGVYLEESMTAIHKFDDYGTPGESTLAREGFFVGSHFLLDILDGGLVPFFYPFSKQA